MKVTRLKAKKEHTCQECNKKITKGQIYYCEKNYCSGYVYDGFRYFETYTEKYCPRCHYYKQLKDQRFADFVKSGKCEHKKIGTKWDYIPGECVMEPQYDYCLICGERLV